MESLYKQKKNLQLEIETLKKSEEDQKDPKLQKMKQIYAEIENTKGRKFKLEEKHKELMKIINSLKVTTILQ